MNKYSMRRDKNHAAIKHALEDIGALVIDTSAVGNIIGGFPDLLVVFCRQLFLVEIKASEKAPVSKQQTKFIERLNGLFDVLFVYNEIDAQDKLINARLGEHAPWQT